MRIIPTLTRCWICLITALGLVGCTHVVTTTNIVASYPKQQKINLSVKLVIPNSLQSAKIENNLTGDIWIIQLGDSLVRNSNMMVEALFAHVDSKEIGTNRLNKEPDIVLMPRLVSAEASHAVWIYDESTITLDMEWTALDNQGNTILTDTVRGEGKSGGGGGFAARGNVEKRVNMAIDKLFLNSYNALFTSPEIRYWEK